MNYRVSFTVQAKDLGTVIGALTPTAEIGSLSVAPINGKETAIKAKPARERGELGNIVLDFLKTKSPATLIELSDFANTKGMHGDSVSPCLSRLALKGLVKRGRMRGTWELVP